MSADLLQGVELWLLGTMVLLFTAHLLWFAFRNRALDVVFSFRMHVAQISWLYFAVKVAEAFPLPGTRTLDFLLFSATLSYAQFVDTLYFFLAIALLVFSLGVVRACGLRGKK